jgi:hypothetical protein
MYLNIGIHGSIFMKGKKFTIDGVENIVRYNVGAHAVTALKFEKSLVKK